MSFPMVVLVHVQVLLPKIWGMIVLKKYGTIKDSDISEPNSGKEITFRSAQGAVNFINIKDYSKYFVVRNGLEISLLDPISRRNSDILK